MSGVPGTNTGHGHVWLRPDGVKARCGGPAICSECAKDQAQLDHFKSTEQLGARKEVGEARPKDDAVIVTECDDCDKAIVWSQFHNRWLHQATYQKECSEKRKS